ncbi:MAG TPA: glycosyltransferase family 4 protein [Gammaproteobacteria bacterium]|nr:glycosyltransferase family 4 protein [Gammaproteobacteria bacterium]
MNNRRPRVAFVVQRCGEEVNGGSEAHCLAAAIHMQAEWDVEILTTCAVDYTTWNNYYPPGRSEVRGVSVTRFSVAESRDMGRFSALCRDLFSRLGSVTIEEAEKWMDEQGPLSPDLLGYIDRHRQDYDAFLFFTYLYATTYQGLPLVADRAYLVPTAHDEPPIYLPIWDSWFQKPQGFILNTPEEKQFLEQRFPSVHLKGQIAGVGIDLPADYSSQRFRSAYGVHDPYMLYVGRIDINKGCGELFDYFQRYKTDRPEPLKLVLAGKPIIPIPEHPDIISLGFVDEQTKFDAISGAALVVNPSPYESLSMILLEAWSLDRPVLVSGKSAAMVGQCKRSNGGLWYESYPEFVACIKEIGRNRWIACGANRFIESNYAWLAIRKKYLSTISFNTNGRRE